MNPQTKLRKRQFKGTSKPRLFFDRKLRPAGNTRVVSLGKVLPEGWSYIRMEIVDRTENTVTVQFTKLLEAEPVACDTNTD